MIAVRGIYDGKIIKPLEKVDVPANTEVIITFLGENPAAGNDETFLATFGAWSDIDADKLLREIYANRRGSSRPEVRL